jgi:hypothetical protein
MQKVLEALEQCRYSVLSESDDLDQVYRLRYDSYLAEDAILKNERRMMSDSYDESPNCVHVVVEMDGEYIAALRLHLLSNLEPHSPSLEVFPEIREHLDSGQTILDPTRFVVHPGTRKNFLPLHLVALRIPFLAAVSYDVDIVLAAVRSEHSAFYRRYLGCDNFAAPRPYLGLTKPLGLMMTIMAESRDKVLEKYPFFGRLESIPQSDIDFPKLPGVRRIIEEPDIRVA